MIDDFSDRLKQIKEDRKDISREIKEAIKEEKKKEKETKQLKEGKITGGASPVEKNQKPDNKNSNFVPKAEDLINKIKTIQQHLQNTILQISNINIKNGYEETCQKILDKAQKLDNAFGDFARNYQNMVDANTINADKYFHAKANCEAAQRGYAGIITAQGISIFRELEEGARKVIFESANLIEQIKDAKEDMSANKKGRDMVKKFPYGNCKILIKDMRPNGLIDKY